MKNKLLLLLMFSLLNFLETNAQCSITASTNASSLSCGIAPLSSCGGILYLGDGTTAMTLTMNASLNLSCLGPIQLIVRNLAAIDFTSGNNYLTLATGSSIIFLPGSNLVGGSCNASERIYIGTDLIASCNGNGPGADYSFSQLIALGGFNITTGSFSPNYVCGSGILTGTAVAIPSSGATIKWYTVFSGGTPVFTGNPFTTPTISTTTIYYVEAFYSSTSFTTPRTAVTATVNPLPFAPTIGTITQPNCTLATGSVVLNNLPSGSWTLTRTGTSGATTTGTGTTTTVSGLAAGTYNFIVNNGTCTSTSSASVVINSATNTTWNGSSWSNGIPTLSTSVIINGNYDTTTLPSIDACSVTVNSPFVVTIVANKNVNIQNQLAVITGGRFTVNDDASLIQINDNAVNTGNINVLRTTDIRLQDYVYWSSPVENFSLPSISTSTPSGYFWKWNTTVSNSNGGLGNWQNTSEIMIVAKGYIVRAPNGWNATTPTAFTATFAGKPNNGTITATIERGSYTGLPYLGTNGTLITRYNDNWNLIGNPYPSAINANSFLTTNTNIVGAVIIWTHATLPTSTVNQFYSSFVYNYTQNDYIIYNATGATNGPSGFNGYIGSGQSFFILMNDGAATTGTVTFNNAMRDKSYNNSQFYKNADVTKSVVNIEKNRIWLDLVSPTQQAVRAVIGYVEGATNAKDRMFDAYSSYKPAMNLFSLIDDDIISIQGKSLPFLDSDTVPLGIKVPTNGTYTLAIAAVDGLFENGNQTIYLEDKKLNVIHNLTVSPYQFDGVQGIDNERFVIRYNNAALSNTDFNSLSNTILVSVSENNIKINSSQENIKSYTVYDVLGRILVSKNNLNAKEFDINTLLKNNQALIVKIILENNQIITKKMVF